MYIFFIILLILSIPFILALFAKETYQISRETIIDKPLDEVFNYIRFQKNGDHYNKWMMTDPGMRKSFRGTDGQTGFVYAWDSDKKNAGKGEQEIISITEGERIDSEIRFIKPFVSVATVHFTTEPTAAGQTKLGWMFRGRKNYMMKVMHLVMNLDKMLGKDMETSLNNLKTILENK